MVAEQQRLAYLQAMGVDNYYPRLQLPHAAVSKLCEPLDVPGEVDDPSHSLAVSALLSELETEPVSLDRARVDSAPAAQTTDLPDSPAQFVEAVPEFALAWTIVSGSMVFIDEGIPANAQTKDYQELALNICRALGYPAQTIQYEKFVWPMLRNQQVNQGEQAAREALSAFWHRIREASQPQAVMVMSPTALDYLSFDEPGLNLVQSESLQQLLQVPASKPALWQRIRAIKLDET